MVAYPGHDVAEVAQAVVGQGAEQQAARRLDVTGQDPLEVGQAVRR
ncbi:hypothetical protein [Streptomyces sp. NPDC102462]